MLTVDQIIASMNLKAFLGSSGRDGCPSDASRSGGGAHGSNNSEVKRAGVMLVIKDGLILGISRRDNKELFGLLGGKFDPDAGDEYTSDTAMREAKEEAGIDVITCVKIYQRMEPGGPDGIDFYSTCYYATEWNGEPKNSEEGEVKWLTAEEICSTKAAFGDYNRKTLDVFKTMYPDVYLQGE